MKKTIRDKEKDIDMGYKIGEYPKGDNWDEALKKGARRIANMIKKERLNLINSMEFIDSSCSGGECEYVLVEDNPENRDKIYKLGLTDKDIKDKCYPDEGSLEISILAWELTDAEYYNGKEKKFTLSE